MSVIRVVWGSGHGPTATAAYDAALAGAGVHDYNLVSVSSVVPAGPAVEAVGTAPDLGPPGEALTVVQARASVEPSGEDGDAGDDERDPAVAAVGWARSADGPGVFYEAGGRDPTSVRERVHAGLEHGVGLREWEPAERDLVLERTDPDHEEQTCAVVCAVYGESRPLL